MNPFDTQRHFLDIFATLKRSQLCSDFQVALRQLPPSVKNIADWLQQNKIHLFQEDYEDLINLKEKLIDFHLFQEGDSILESIQNLANSLIMGMEDDIYTNNNTNHHQNINDNNHDNSNPKRGRGRTRTTTKRGRYLDFSSTSEKKPKIVVENRNENATSLIHPDFFDFFMKWGGDYSSDEFQKQTEGWSSDDDHSNKASNFFIGGKELLINGLFPFLNQNELINFSFLNKHYQDLIYANPLFTMNAFLMQCHKIGIITNKLRKSQLREIIDSHKQLYCDWAARFSKVKISGGNLPKLVYIQKKFINKCYVTFVNDKNKYFHLPNLLMPFSEINEWQGNRVFKYLILENEFLHIKYHNFLQYTNESFITDPKNKRLIYYYYLKPLEKKDQEPNLMILPVGIRNEIIEIKNFFNPASELCFNKIPRLKKDIEWVKFLSQLGVLSDEHISELDKELNNNRELWFLLVENHKVSFNAAPKHISKDKEIILKKLQYRNFRSKADLIFITNLFNSINLELFENAEVCAAAFLFFIRHYPPFTKEDLFSIFLEIMKGKINFDLSINRDFVFYVVKEDGDALKYFPSFQDDADIVLLAIKKVPYLLEYASSRLRKDPIFISNLLNECHTLVKQRNQIIVENLNTPGWVKKGEIDNIVFGLSDSFAFFHKSLWENSLIIKTLIQILPTFIFCPTLRSTKTGRNYFEVDAQSKDCEKIIDRIPISVILKKEKETYFNLLSSQNEMVSYPIHAIINKWENLKENYFKLLEDFIASQDETIPYPCIGIIKQWSDLNDDHKEFKEALTPFILKHITRQNKAYIRTFPDEFFFDDDFFASILKIKGINLSNIHNKIKNDERMKEKMAILKKQSEENVEMQD